MFFVKWIIYGGRVDCEQGGVPHCGKKVKPCAIWVSDVLRLGVWVAGRGDRLGVWLEGAGPG